MEGLEFLVLAPLVLGFLGVWTWLFANKRIPVAIYLTALVALGIVGYVAFRSEYRYVFYVEGLEEAAIDGNAQRADWLIRNGADPNERDDNDALPLQFAVIDDHPDVVRILLQHGADPNIDAGMDDHRSLVQFAEDSKLIDEVKLLKSAGGRP